MRSALPHTAKPSDQMPEEAPAEQVPDDVADAPEGEAHPRAPQRGREASRRLRTQVDASIVMPDSLSMNGEGRRHETPLERLDRNLEELTGELRVVVTGVQVLFAFLLIVPFNVGFAHVGGFERTVYFVTLVLSALAAVCTIAPSAAHRFLFRHDDKQHIVFSSNRVVIAGLSFLALAMCGCLLLVTTKLFGVLAGVLAASLGAIPFAILWFARPIIRLRALAARPRARAPIRAGARDRLDSL